MHRKWLAVPIFLAKHSLSAAVALSSIRGVELLTQLLWNGEDPRLLEVIHIRYIFDLMDLGILVLYVGWGLYEANKVFREANR